MAVINLKEKKNYKIAKDKVDNIQFLFSNMKTITIENKDYKADLFKKIKKYLVTITENLYKKLSLYWIKDLSNVSAKQAIEYLNKIDLSKPCNIELLKTSVRHSNKEVILRGISILKKIRTIDSRKVLCTALNSKDQEIVISAIEALKLFKNQEVVKPIANCLGRKDKKVALTSLWALAEVKTPEAFTAIESVLNHKDDDIRQTAMWILNGSKNIKSKKKEKKKA